VSLTSGSSIECLLTRTSDIADVSHFVLPDNPMDAEAAARGTTVYLVDKRIDMLPALLGTNLCSLRPFVERLAFSVIWVGEMPLSRLRRSIFAFGVGVDTRGGHCKRSIYEVCYRVKMRFHLRGSTVAQR